MSNPQFYISNCINGIVIKNGSYFEANTYGTISNCVDAGVVVLNNSTFTTLKKPVNALFDDNRINWAINVHDSKIGYVVSHNSVGNIGSSFYGVDSGIIYANNSSGEVYYSSFIASPGIDSSNNFCAAVYVQDSVVMLRDLDDTSGWGSLTGATGPTNYRVNGGTIITKDTSLATPEISDIAIGLNGGKVARIEYAGGSINPTVKMTASNYYYPKLI